MAMTCVLTGRTQRPPWRPDREVTFIVEAPDMPALVVAFLSELVWLHESEGLLWLGGGVVLREEKGMLRAEAAGNMAPHDAASHGRGVEVKAVTYHNLAFGRQGASWRLWVLLDI